MVVSHDDFVITNAHQFQNHGRLNFLFKTSVRLNLLYPYGHQYPTDQNRIFYFVVVRDTLTKQKTKSTLISKRIFKILEKYMKSIVTEDMILLLTAHDAALLCGVSTRTWRLWDEMGYTPQPVHIGRSVFWKHKELNQWIDAGCPKRENWVYREKKAK